ncbi:MAG TPA: YggS family pyridoxal phosphate-dependent enzyme [Fibrobacteria bacterium]|nr:YggS family pyridoxal phosphate-dependent enzyme [Fibrobacteria bacterium]
MDTLAERLHMVERRIEDACRIAGRNRAEVTLVAVSKRHSAAEIGEAVALGLSEFGENYVQEALEKFPVPSANLHFIGSLQKNKVRKILPITALVHGVSSLPVLEAVERVAGEEGIGAEFLLQLHLTEEPTKHGFAPEDIPEAVAMADGFRHARLRGFMVMAPLDGGREAARPVFARARTLLEGFREGRPGMGLLSMGMSQDLEEAILEGATHLRVGTAVFGERSSP